MSDKVKLATVIITVVVLIAAAATAVLLTQGIKEPSYAVGNGAFEINGLYDVSVNLAGDDVTLVADTPL